MLLLLGLLLPLGLFSQTGKEALIDSLKKELSRATTDTTKINILCRLSDNYPGIDSLKTFEIGHKALQLSEDIGYLKGEADAYLTLGEGYSDYSMIDKAVAYLTKGSELAEKLIRKDSSKSNLKIWADGHYNLGINYAYTGDYDKYLRLTDKVIPIVKAIGDSLFLANIHTNLGAGNINLKQYESAYESLEVANDIYERFGFPQESTYNTLSFAMALYHLDSLDRMKISLDQAELNLDKYPNAYDSYNLYTHKAMYYEGKKSYTDAIAALDKALTFAQGDTYSVQHAIIYERYAQVYESMNDYAKALTYQKKYLKSSEIRNDRFSYSKTLKSIARLKAKNQDYRGAYADVINGMEMEDSLNNVDKVTQLAELELKYNTEKKEREILALQNANSKNMLSSERKRSQLYLIVGITSILAMLSFAGYIFYRNKLRKAKKKEQLQEAQLQLLKQEQQNKIYAAMIEGQEKERKRLAIDLHDGLGGRLSGISLNLSKLYKDRPETFKELHLEKVTKNLDDSLTELRSIARNMMPETLLKFGLKAALKDYCNSMNSKETQITLQFYGNESGIDGNQKITVYRVIQELINNAIKHAKASEILVQYIREGDIVDITVEDNGVGFAKETPSVANSGMGLSNLRTRVAFLKGDLNFQTQKNEGTTVNVHLSLTAA